jgi:hypothetical protein
MCLICKMFEDKKLSKKETIKIVLRLFEMTNDDTVHQHIFKILKKNKRR